MTNSANIDFDKYIDFVGDVTSNASSSPQSFVHRVVELERREEDDHIRGEKVDLNRLLTAAIGISAEGGEFAEIVKKITFQGKPYNEANREHMIVELGDVMWYVAQACISLGVSFEQIVQRNFEKLTARYPEGTFSIDRSENRREGDI
jgi:NTP pyrophosphatase (non-canonical NTP hydrolase)